jgi:hypothetical protein
MEKTQLSLYFNDRRLENPLKGLHLRFRGNKEVSTSKELEEL